MLAPSGPARRPRHRGRTSTTHWHRHPYPSLPQRCLPPRLPPRSCSRSTRFRPGALEPPTIPEKPPPPANGGFPREAYQKKRTHAAAAAARRRLQCRSLPFVRTLAGILLVRQVCWQHAFFWVHKTNQTKPHEVHTSTAGACCCATSPKIAIAWRAARGSLLSPVRQTAPAATEQRSSFLGVLGSPV